MKFIKYFSIFIFGFLIGKLVYDKEKKPKTQEEIQIISGGIKNLSKLVVSEGSFAEIYSFSDSKKYFYDVISFDKKAIVSVNAKVEIGYDMSKLIVQIDSIGKQIIINKIPEETITIIPEIKYFDLQESSFNSFSTEELNKLNKKSVEKIKENIEIIRLKRNAKNRLFAELSKIYQLSKTYGWSVVDNTGKNIQFIKN